MSADGRIEIDTEINTQPLEEGLSRVNRQMRNTSAGAENLDHSVRGAGHAMGETAEEGQTLVDKLKEIFKKGGTAATVMGTVTKATKIAAQAIRETSEALKTQTNAERALAQAAQNNPYINKQNVESLKNYASELQSVSNIGDEMSINLMANLVAAGRTEEQIKKIFLTAANASATGTISFESAVENLNNTLNGEAGEIADLVPAVHNLTAEQLQNGDAVDLVNKKFAGMAETLADSRIQAQNAKGDFAEALGKMTAPSATAWDNFWKSFYEKGIEAINWVDEKLNNVSMRFTNKDITEAFGKSYEVDGQEKTYAYFMDDESLDRWRKYYQTKKDVTAEERQALIYIRAEQSHRKTIAQQAERQKALEEKARKEQEEKNKLLEEQLQKEKEIIDARKNLNDRAADIKENNEESLRSTLERLDAEAKYNNRAVDEQARYNAIYNSYLDLMAQDDSLISENNELVKTRLSQLKEETKALEEYNKEQEQKNKNDEAEKQIKNISLYESEYDKLLAESDDLLNLKEQINNNEVQLEEGKAEALEKIDAKILENKNKTLELAADAITDYANQWFDVIKNTADVIGDYQATKNDNDLANLEKKYKAGEVGEKEYNEKKKEIQKKAAQDEYRANMAAWSMSLAQATANIAEGVTKAIAQGGVMGIATGAIVSAAGAVQLASIIGSKPVLPAFAKGGIVGGTSYHGDNISARVNSGEMVLTMAQQRALFDVANGSGAMSAPNITVNNSAANLVDVTPSISANNINLMIDARVKEGLQNGAYNESLTMAQQGQNGTYYGI